MQLTAETDADVFVVGRALGLMATRSGSAKEEARAGGGSTLHARSRATGSISRDLHHEGPPPGYERELAARTSGPFPLGHPRRALGGRGRATGVGRGRRSGVRRAGSTTPQSAPWMRAQGALLACEETAGAAQAKVATSALRSGTTARWCSSRHLRHSGRRGRQYWQRRTSFPLLMERS